MCCRCCISVESPRISLLLEQPTDEEEKGVKPTMDYLRQLLPVVQPPLDRPLLLHNHNVLKMQSLNPAVPHLVTERASEQYVVHRFHLLVTDDTSVQLLKAMAKPSVCHPTATVHDEPKEELNSQRR